MAIVLFLLGIAGIVINANGWFIVPSIVIVISFGVSGVMIALSFIQSIRTGKEIKRRFRI